MLKGYNMKVYIDCGAHVGLILKRNLKKFDIFHAFEANPNLISGLQKIANDNDNNSIYIYNNAVWDRKDTIDFYLSRGYDTGSTVMKGKKTGNVDYNHPVSVESIDFSEWIFQNLKKDDYNYLKMDIEGAEYDVLEKMIKDESIFYIDEFLIEFHDTKIDQPNIKDRHKNIVKYIKKNNIKCFHHFISGQKPV